MKQFAILVAVFLGVAAGSADGAVIDFQALETANANPSNFVPNFNFYDEDGFRLSDGSGILFPGTLTTQWANSGNSTAIHSNNPTDLITMVDLGGNPFGVSTVDLSELSLSAGTPTARFIGNKVGGGSVIQTIILDDLLGVETFNLQLLDPAFSALTSLDFQDFDQSTFTQVQFDNITITSVPEPTTLLLMASGLACLVGYARRGKAT